MVAVGDLKKALIEYVSKKQVAFQYCDELIDFTNDGKDEQAKKLLQEIESSSVCLIKDRGDNPGFEDIIDWAIPSDILFKLDSGIVICIPGRDNKMLNINDL